MGTVMTTSRRSTINEPDSTDPGPQSRRCSNRLFGSSRRHVRARRQTSWHSSSSSYSRIAGKRRGDLVAVRKGLYFKGVKTRYGMTRPSSEAIAVEVLGTLGVGPTGHSAARALGITTQVPAKPSLTVAGPVPTSVPGVTVSKRNNMRRRELYYLEIALLELLRADWESTVEGGWPVLVSAAAGAIRDGKVRPSAVAEALATEHSPAARANFARLTTDLRTRRRGRSTVALA
ncbi:MAG: hypothetical protein JWN95_4007 [Frankiales bacterium]|nr:hypothetical protein [Frankiales bacterium]